MNLSHIPAARYLSVRQPWAQLIVAGVKPIENRPWSTAYRGPLFIHASRTPSATPLAAINERYGLQLAADQFQFGGIVGVVTLASIVCEHPSPFFDGPIGDKGKPNYGLVFTRPQRLPLFPMRGGLMIRSVPVDVLAFYREALISYADAGESFGPVGHESRDFVARESVQYSTYGRTPRLGDASGDRARNSRCEGRRVDDCALGGTR
jgi:hypothetical protein